MILSLFLRLVALAAAVALTAWLLPGFTVDGGAPSYFWIAVLFAIVNIILGTILVLLTLPLIILTFGLFALVVNAALLGVTAWLSPDLSIDNFGTLLVGALLISIFAGLSRIILPGI